MKIAIAYASLSGNTTEVASKIQEYLQGKGLASQLFDLIETNADDLKEYDLVFMGSSTYGDGELNPIAELFFSMTTPSSHDCDHTNFALFALGDPSYPLYGRSGEIMREKMQRMHANILLPIQIFESGFSGISEETTTQLYEWVEVILVQVQV